MDGYKSCINAGESGNGPHVLQLQNSAHIHALCLHTHDMCNQAALNTDGLCTFLYATPKHMPFPTSHSIALSSPQKPQCAMTCSIPCLLSPHFSLTCDTQLANMPVA